VGIGFAHFLNSFSHILDWGNRQIQSHSRALTKPVIGSRSSLLVETTYCSRNEVRITRPHSKHLRIGFAKSSNFVRHGYRLALSGFRSVQTRQTGPSLRRVLKRRSHSLGGREAARKCVSTSEPQITQRSRTLFCRTISRMQHTKMIPSSTSRNRGTSLSPRRWAASPAARAPKIASSIVAPCDLSTAIPGPYRLVACHGYASSVQRGATEQSPLTAPRPCARRLPSQTDPLPNFRPA